MCVCVRARTCVYMCAPVAGGVKKRRAQESLHGKLHSHLLVSCAEALGDVARLSVTDSGKRYLFLFAQAAVHSASAAAAS